MKISLKDEWENKLRDLKTLLCAAEDECKSTPQCKKQVEELSEKMYEAVNICSELKIILSRLKLIKDYRLMCYSWKQYAEKSYLNLMFTYDFSDETFIEELWDRAVSRIHLLKKAVDITDDEYRKNNGNILQVADVYYSLAEGLEMEEPGLYFAHNNEFIAALPVRVSAFVTGMTMLWEEAEKDEKVLYRISHCVIRQTYELICLTTSSTAKKSAQIISDYGDYLSHTADIYNQQYPDYAIYARRLDTRFKSISDEMYNGRIYMAVDGIESMISEVFHEKM